MPARRFSSAPAHPSLRAPFDALVPWSCRGTATSMRRSPHSGWYKPPILDAPVRVLSQALEIGARAEQRGGGAPYGCRALTTSGSWNSSSIMSCLTVGLSSMARASTPLPFRDATIDPERSLASGLPDWVVTSNGFPNPPLDNPTTIWRRAHPIGPGCRRPSHECGTRSRNRSGKEILPPRCVKRHRHATHPRRG